MDSLINAAARALAAGDPIGALKRIALRDDAQALALRGIAMAQLGEYVRARALLRSAARAFGPQEAVARARCTVAEGEAALASRDLGWPAKALEAARATLAAHGDAWWPGLVGGLLAAALAQRAVGPVFAGARARLPDRAAREALSLYLDAASLLLAVLVALLHPLGYVAIALLVWFVWRARTHADQKYAGLRILRR